MADPVAAARLGESIQVENSLSGYACLLAISLSLSKGPAENLTVTILPLPPKSVSLKDEGSAIGDPKRCRQQSTMYAISG